VTLRVHPVTAERRPDLVDLFERGVVRETETRAVVRRML